MISITIWINRQIFGIPIFTDHPLHPVPRSHNTQMPDMIRSCHAAFFNRLKRFTYPTAIVNHIVAQPDATYTDQCTPGDMMISVIILSTIAAIQQNVNICNTFFPS